ncbi:MAG: pyridoxal-phosphate dependent enzyme [Planctomycetales bacterium]|nr:pyridoxal-phosphate dependent enzyme [Planctomycetales bacterium]
MSRGPLPCSTSDGAQAAYAVTLADVQAAAARIVGHARRTPVETCAALDDLAGCSLFFKCEQLQKVGAFKFRGAANSVLRLDEPTAARGVATHSSGNHAQALALAAARRGIPAHIVMPSSAPAVKQRAVAGYGARIVLCEPTLAAREETTRQFVAETGAAFIHPYDHPDVIAGQGTVALELLEQVASLDAIIAPVGGGGLLSGICIAARALRPGMRIFAAEPAGADDALRSFEAGRIVPQTGPRTIADGLLTSLGALTWPILRDHVERVFTVSDDEIISAMRLTWERAKLLIEPSSATAVAVALCEAFHRDVDAARVGVVLTGGNVDLDRLPWISAAGR